MIKFASNAFLASKISFINEIGNICKKLGIDVYEVADAMGHDKRIGKEFLRAGAGFGGSCFTKDMKALVEKSKEFDVDTHILSAVLKVNELQRKRIVDILKSKIDIKGKKIAILGMAFKDGTDDVRDAVSVDVIKSLLSEGANVFAYDLKAKNNMIKIFPDLVYCSNIQETLDSADACLVLTELPEFNKLTDNDFSAMKNKIIIEGRRILDRGNVSNFEGVCW